MRSLLFTPKSRTRLMIFGIALILLQPGFSIAHYAWNLAANAYPPEANSMGIPIFSEFAIWLAVAPLAIPAIVRILRHYPGSLPIFRHQSLSHQSISINLVFALLISATLLQLRDVLLYGNLPMLVDVTLVSYLLLCMRAVVISQWWPRRARL